MGAAPAAALADGLAALGLAPPVVVRERLLVFAQLLDHWSTAYNLTAVRGVAEMVPRHLLDSLAVAPYLQGARVLDVGSGAGLPGIPLALVDPRREFTLLDSSAKRCRFLRQAIHELQLQNASVVQGRVEECPAQDKFDTLVARAFSDLPTLLSRAGRLCAPGGVILAMKGKLREAERAGIPAGFSLIKQIPLDVPGLDAERNLIMVAPD
ncbi:MAG: 16S rRNA (guanine(527)-N(7))-methyltransferase RsmG [Gammaproteobacteria bacterium]|nr:16S rRNA (guanine(527)-N(7))-methyltransferase RsmG [Gammaproteobacteria bacterium]